MVICLSILFTLHDARTSLWELFFLISKTSYLRFSYNLRFLFLITSLDTRWRYHFVKLICFPNFNCTNVLFDSVWTNWHWKLKLNCVSYLVFGCKQFCAIFSSWSCSNEMHFFLERPWRQVSNMILKVKIYPHEFHFCSLRLLTPKVCEKDKRTFILIQMIVKVIRKKI